MLGPNSLLLFLKGWEYKSHTITRTDVTRGQEPISIVQLDKILEEELGWLYEIAMLTNDAYGTVQIEYQGADLEPKLVTIFPEAAKSIGSTVQDPAGWIPKYYRPNPASTWGMYLVVATSAGLQGSTLPFLPPVRLKLYLPTDSTQQLCSITANATVVAITNAKAFLESLRSVWAIKDLEINPALLIPGPKRLREAVSG